MDIGILTLYKVRNIGACLQATAMKRILEGYGHKVFFIEGYDEAFAKQLYKNDMGKARPWTILFRIQKNHKFQTFFSSYSEIGLQKVCDLDGVIIGSDSLWFADYGKIPMPTVFFGDVNCKTTCTYAPSVGGEYDLKKFTPQQLESLLKIRYITVRDSMSQRFVKAITGKECPIVADPTLLCNWDDYLDQNRRVVAKKKYLMVYGGFDQKTAGAINNFAKRKGLQVINVGIFNRFFGKNVAVSPYEFLQYIHGASYVITCMFHGVMLSVALGKEFRYVSMDSNRDIKTSTALERLGLSHIMLKAQDIWEQQDFFAEPIDYAETNVLLADYRADSRKEIERMLELMGE